MADPCPGWAKLREYQRRAAQAIASREKCGLWMGCGSGKTGTALAAWALDPQTPVLIVTRAIGRKAWPRDAAWVLGMGASELWAGKRRSKSGRHRDGSYSSLTEALHDSPFVVTNYEILKPRYWSLREVPWKWMILDEAHEIKHGYQTKKKYESTGKAKWRKYDYACSLARGVQGRGGHVIELTATPVRDRTRDLWAQLNIVLPQETLRFWPPWNSVEDEWERRCWAGRYCALRHGNYGLDHTGFSNREELSEYLARKFVVLRRADILDELPAITRDVRVVQPDWSYITELSAGGGIEGAIARADQAKRPYALELAFEYLVTGEKVCLVTSRRKLAAELHGALVGALSGKGGASLGRLVPPKLKRKWEDGGLRIECVTGATEARARVALCTEVNDGPGPAALIATMDSITTSIDLHKMHGLIFCALPYTPAGIEQMEGRVARLGGVPCTIHYLVAEEMIDEKIRETVLDKLENVRILAIDTQGSDGAETALRNMQDEDVVMAELREWLKERE